MGAYVLVRRLAYHVNVGCNRARVPVLGRKVFNTRAAEGTEQRAGIRSTTKTTSSPAQVHDDGDNRAAIVFPNLPPPPPMLLRAVRTWRGSERNRRKELRAEVVGAINEKQTEFGNYVLDSSLVVCCRRGAGEKPQGKSSTC